MKMKERVVTILDGFLERNKNYSINVYIKNGVTGNHMALLLIPIERVTEENETEYTLVWDDAQFNNFSIAYDEILGCYEERDEFNQQMVCLFLKNGMMIEFECVGLSL